ncbi:MAG: hypothetical protein ACR5K7_00600 [Symbiopectobacterium sp.]
MHFAPALLARKRLAVKRIYPLVSDQSQQDIAILDLQLAVISRRAARRRR